MRKTILLFVLILLTSHLNAQYFSDSLFNKQIAKYLKPAIKTKTQKHILTSYLTFWESDLEDYHKQLIDLFNDMAHAHLTAEFMLYYIDNSNRLLDLEKPDLLLRWSRQLDKTILTRRTTSMAEQKISYLHELLTTDRISPRKDLGLIIDGGYDFSLERDGSFTFRTLSNVDIKIFLQRDTLIIHSTKGQYNTATHTWKGISGTIFWDRFPRINDKAFVRFGPYTINTSEKTFEIPNVKFTADYKIVRLKNLDGKLIMRFSYSPAVQRQNPKFEAYREQRIENIVPQSIFEGLVSVEGQNIYLHGSLDFLLGQDKLITTTASSYIITPKAVRASKVSFRLMVSTDTAIYHPEVDMLVLYDSSMIESGYPYLAPKVLSYERPRLLSFIRTNGSYGSQPFHDDYHKVEIHTAEMLWAFDSKVYFVNTINRLEDTSFFESYQYYDPYMLAGFGDERGNNYAKLLYQYLRKKDYPDTVDLQSFTRYLLTLGIRTFKKKVFDYLDRMVQRGWIKLTYSDDLSKVKIYGISQRFYHVIRASIRQNFLKDTVKMRKYSDDYDKIRIFSAASVDTVLFARSIGNYTLHGTGINAILNLNTKQLDIFNTLPFFLSSARKVQVSANKVTLFKDFDFRFDGSIKAGLINLKGKDFFYSSDSFYVKLGSVKQMQMRFYRAVDSIYLTSLITDNGDTMDVYRYKYKLDTCASSIYNFSGLLHIDRPDDKSGLLARADDGYPSIEAKTESRIYYEKAPVDSNNFYFVNYPFRLDNLLFITPDNIVMTGTLHSSILADLDSIQLSLQWDKSLGFRTEDTVKGFEIFGAARLVGSLQLDNSGLTSHSYLKFLSTYAWGNFRLMPDSLRGTSDTLIMYPVDKNQQQAQNFPSQFPSIAYNYRADIKLVNNHDSTQTMTIKQLSSKPFVIYPNFLEGQKRAYLDSAVVTVGYDGVKASGVMDFIDAQIRSDQFSLSYDNFTSDTCRFVLKDSTFSQTLFNTSNVSCYMDLATQIGTFVSNTVDNYVVFPRNKYIVYSDHFQWKINEGLIDVGGNLDDPRYTVVTSEDQRDSLIQVTGRNPKFIRLSGTRLVSIRRHNPVNFSASRTTYVPQKNVLLAYDVPYLKIADAQIYSAHPVVIRLGGEIDTIRAARILAGRFGHKIFNATVKVKDSMMYSAQGYYNYPPGQKIFFTTITVVDTTTYAYADMPADTSLKLNDYFKFYGGQTNVDIILKGSDRFLHFNGYVGIENECEGLNPRLVAIDTVINPDTVLIPIRLPIKGKFSRLYATPVVHKIDQSRYRMYNTFLTPIPDNTDRQLMPVQGFLTYSTHKAYYLIGPKEKVINPDTVLPMIAYDYKRCLMFGENNVNWQIDYGDVLKYKAWGRYRAYLDQDRNNLYSTIVALDFPFPTRVLDYITKDINNTDSLQFVFFDENRNLYNTIMLAAQSEKEKQDFEESAELPSSLSGTIVLADLNLVWDPNRVSFRTAKGHNRFVILSINGKELDVYVTGYVEFRYERNDISRILMYIEIEPDVWYFFWYQFRGKNGTMRIASYDNRAEKYISQMPRKQRQMVKHFTVGTAEFDELIRFLKLYGKKL